MNKNNMLNTEKYDFSPPWLKNKTPLVLIHGLGASTKMWFPQIPAFSAHFPVILIDLPGCGKSSAIEGEYRIEDAVELVRNTLSKMNINRINILGISFGGFVALEYANKYTDEVNSLILASTPNGFSDTYKTGALKMLQTYKDLSIKEIIENRIDKAFGKLASNEIKDYLIEIIVQTEHSVYLNMAHAPLSYNFQKSSRNITQKTLIINGELDYLATIESANIIKKQIQNSSVYILKDTGHACSMENPVAFNKQVLKFFGVENI